MDLAKNYYESVVIWQHLLTQEYIPVGCVPPAHSSYLVVSAGGYPPGGTCPGGPAWGVYLSGVYLPRGGTCPGTGLLCTEFLTHSTENITLPQTSFAGGNYANLIISISPTLTLVCCLSIIIAIEFFVLKK